MQACGLSSKNKNRWSSLYIFSGEKYASESKFVILFHYYFAPTTPHKIDQQQKAVQYEIMIQWWPAEVAFFMQWLCWLQILSQILNLLVV